MRSEERRQAPSKTLTIHVVGAAETECASEDSVRQCLGPFVRWLDAALHRPTSRQPHEESLQATAIATGSHAELTDIDSLLIEFSGPNMPNAMIGKVVDFLVPSKSQPFGGLISAKAIFQQREYHETGDTEASSADITIAFNAGIWGYDSWKVTIGYMCRSMQSLFVITAYTVEECEDDDEVVVEATKAASAERSLASNSEGIAIARQIWAPETNPFASRLERTTAAAPPGRKYFENGAWQAWLLGA